MLPVHQRTAGRAFRSQRGTQVRLRAVAQQPARRHGWACVAAAAQPAGAPAAPPAAPGHRGHVLIVPAFYLDAVVFAPLAAALRARGYNAALPPVRWWHWLCTLGGRSVRPILDRVDYALTQLVEGYEVTEEGGWQVPPPRGATFGEWLREYSDASKGAKPPLPLTGPRPGSPRAALVASSAGGWISRILLAAGPPYCGTVYYGADRVHTLVSLGTPHTSAEPVTRRNIDFVNNSYPGAHMPGVRYVAVGSRTVQGRTYGPVQDFAYQSYNICCGDGSAWGDGVTPLECSIALPGAEHIVLEGAEHVPVANGQRDWYGSGPYLEAWIAWLDDPSLAGASGSGAAGSPLPGQQQVRAPP